MTDIGQKITQQLLDAGAVIQTGWLSFDHMAIPEQASNMQRAAMRQAFFAGAHHVFQSIICMLEPGEEPTDNDIKRMDSIRVELDEFIEEFKQHNLPTAGRA